VTRACQCLLRDSTGETGHRSQCSRVLPPGEGSGIMPATHKPTRVLRLPAVRDRTGLSAATIYRQIKAGRFPKPIKVCGDHGAGWIEAEVEDYIQAR
jgi:prophage regulatory protein